MVAVMDKVATATLQSSYDSIFASIPVYDGSDTKEFGPGFIELNLLALIHNVILVWKLWERALEEC